MAVLDVHWADPQADSPTLTINEASNIPKLFPKAVILRSPLAGPFAGLLITGQGSEKSKAAVREADCSTTVTTIPCQSVITLIPALTLHCKFESETHSVASQAVPALASGEYED
eukprot:1983570-Rhodomonas_salina.2